MSLQDAIYVPIYILFVVMTLFISVYVWTQFQTNFAVTVADTPYNATIVAAMNDIQGGLNSFDYVFPILIIGLLITSLIFAFKTGANIAYAFVAIILWGIALLISSVLSTVFTAFQTSFPTMAATYPVITYIMINIKWLVLMWLFLVSIVMFTRNKREEQAISAAEAAYMR